MKKLMDRLLGALIRASFAFCYGVVSTAMARSENYALQCLSIAMVSAVAAIALLYIEYEHLDE